MTSHFPVPEDPPIICQPPRPVITEAPIIVVAPQRPSAARSRTLRPSHHSASTAGLHLLWGLLLVALVCVFVFVGLPILGLMALVAPGLVLLLACAAVILTPVLLIFQILSK